MAALTADHLVELKGYQTVGLWAGHLAVLKVAQMADWTVLMMAAEKAAYWDENWVAL